MPFKKGQDRPKEWYKKVGRPKKEDPNARKNTSRKNPNAIIDKYFIHKTWVKQASKKVDNIEDIEYYIYNDIPLEEYYKKLKK